LRLRHSSAKPEVNLPTSEVKGAPKTGAGTELAVAAAVWEQLPCNSVCLHTGEGGGGPGFLTLGLAGNDFELHALFPATVLPADALAAAQRLVGLIRRDAPALFLGKLPTY
jgi:hypothetical protein